jgi:peptide/histidine transporter 3/4
MLFSLWLLWFAMSIQTGSLVIQSFTCYVPYYIVKYGAAILSMICISIGSAGFIASVITCGLDQMEEASTESIRRYIRWIAWGIMVGLFFGTLILTSILGSTEISHITMSSQISSLVLFICLTAVILINMWFKKGFVNQTYPYDTYKVVFKVLLYAWKTKVPVNRSAFTYSEMPNRIDLNKSKYGGNFSEETVEDVKTLLRIMVIFLVLSFYYLVYSGSDDILPIEYAEHLHKEKKIIDLAILNGVFFVPIFGIPLLEVLLKVSPKIEYFLSKPLRGMIIGYVFLIITNAFMFGIDTSAHLYYNGSDSNDNCYLTQPWINQNTLNYPYWWLLVFARVSCGFSYLFMFVSALSFISSQAPYSMRGMLIGTYYLLHGLFIGLGDVTFNQLQHVKDVIISCGFWYWLLLLLISVFGCFVFIIAAWKYKPRSRNEYYNQLVVEDIFVNRVKHNELTINSDNFTIHAHI